MKVFDVMSKHVDYVLPNTPLVEVSKMIFGRGVNGVPVCNDRKNKKVIGFITEKDILSNFLPTMQEYIEDPVHSRDFEDMEQKVDEILKLPAEKIMSKNPTLITADTPLLKAQSAMQLTSVGRVPVVDEEGSLIGILSKGDIFRSVVGDKLPFEADELFHDWLSRRYDLIVDWKERLSKEIPDFVSLFRKEKINRILDVGCGTGVHDIELAKNDLQVVGLDSSKRMIFVANEHRRDLAPRVQRNLQFINHEYRDLDKVLIDKFDAAIFMGSGLAHIKNPKEVLKEVNKVLNRKALIVCQIANYDKVINVNKRFYDFHVRRSPFSNETEEAFLRFYDEEEDGYLTYNVSVFTRGEKRWSFRGIHSTPISPLNKEKITQMLKKLGFLKFQYFGEEKGFYYDYLFKKTFDIDRSDVLNIVAKR